jgi:hypothetical protein
MFTARNRGPERYEYSGSNDAKVAGLIYNCKTEFGGCGAGAIAVDRHDAGTGTDSDDLCLLAK